MKSLLIGLLLCLITLCTYANTSGYIVVQNQYFPKPGKEKEVYKLRLHASEILVKLGLPKGRVLKRTNLSDRLYVMWECDYSSIEESKKGMKIVSGSAGFKRLESKMGTLVNGFKRYIWEVEK